MKMAKAMDSDDIIVVCLSGRGDKDAESIQKYKLAKSNINSNNSNINSINSNNNNKINSNNDNGYIGGI
jgi:tryptophan synthase beta chain